MRLSIDLLPLFNSNYSWNICKFSQSFSKLRISSHRLQIEAGRWARHNTIPLNESKCSFCQVIEDEFPFVLECQLYSGLRKKYISKYNRRRPSMVKFLELLNSNNQTRIRKLEILYIKPLNYVPIYYIDRLKDVCFRSVLLLVVVVF